MPNSLINFCANVNKFVATLHPGPLRLTGPVAGLYVERLSATRSNTIEDEIAEVTTASNSDIEFESLGTTTSGWKRHFDQRE